MSRTKKKAKQRVSELRAKKKVQKLQAKRERVLKNIKSNEDGIKLGQKYIEHMAEALGKMSGMVGNAINFVAANEAWTKESRDNCTAILIENRSKIYDFRDTELVGFTNELSRLKLIHDRTELIVQMLEFVTNADNMLDRLKETEESMNLAMAELEAIPEAATPEKVAKGGAVFSTEDDQIKEAEEELLEILADMSGAEAVDQILDSDGELCTSVAVAE